MQDDFIKTAMATFHELHQVVSGASDIDTKLAAMSHELHLIFSFLADILQRRK